MKTDLKALRALCDAATDGGEKFYINRIEEDNGDIWYEIQSSNPTETSALIQYYGIEAKVQSELALYALNNARFIAASDPQTVRALIDEIE